MTPDERNIRSPHDLSTADGCLAEADRVYRLCREDKLAPEICYLAWFDWLTEARLIDSSLTNGFV